MDQTLHTLLQQIFLQVIAAAGLDDVEMKDVFRALTDGRGDDVANSLQRFRIKRGGGAAGRVAFIKKGQLDVQYSGLQGIEAAVFAQFVMEIFFRRTVVAQCTDAVGQYRIRW